MFRKRSFVKSWWNDGRTLAECAQDFHYAAQCLFGEILFALRIKPTYSRGICGRWTCGYGELSSNGYWQYPVPSEERRIYLDEKEEEIST